LFIFIIHRYPYYRRYAKDLARVKNSIIASDGDDPMGRMDIIFSVLLFELVTII